jgi:hypothetical protein
MAKDITLSGGWDCGFSANTLAATKIQSLTIDMLSGAVIVDNIEIN